MQAIGQANSAALKRPTKHSFSTVLFGLGLQCKSSRYEPLEGADDLHDGDAEEDADGSAKL